jgi:hypothetical protein
MRPRRVAASVEVARQTAAASVRVAKITAAGAVATALITAGGQYLAHDTHASASEPKIVNITPRPTPPRPSCLAVTKDIVSYAESHPEIGVLYGSKASATLPALESKADVARCGNAGAILKRLQPYLLKKLQERRSRR